VSVYLPVPFVDRELGSSIIYEECKGDFRKARLIAQKALDEARRGTDAAALGDALLARGVVHLLQGECASAVGCFGEVTGSSEFGWERRLRASSFTHLTNISNYNSFPDGAGANGAELELRWNGVEYLKEELIQRKPLFSEAKESSVRFESWLVHDFLPSLQSARSFLQNSRFNSPTTMGENLLKVALGGPSGFRRDVETYDGPVSLLTFVDLSCADLCWRAGNPILGGEFLDRAFGLARGSSDAVGLALCELKRGDWLVAPFNTPLVWNLALKESSIGGSELAWTLEKEEFRQNQSTWEDARSAYGKAEHFFVGANAPRGVANVQLRLGYMALVERDYSKVVNYALKAEKMFEGCEDWLGYRLAQAHRILSLVSDGRFPEEQTVAEEIGSWGATQGSFSYAFGLGLFLGRFGRHWLIREGDYERALACFRLATSLFRALGASLNVAGSRVDQAEVHRALSDRATSLTLYEEAMDCYEKNTSAARKYAIMVANNLYQLYQDEMNPDGMKRTINRMQHLVEEFGGQGALGNQLGALNVYALTSLARSSIEQASVLVPVYKALEAQRAGDAVGADTLFGEALSRAREANSESKAFLEAVVFAHQKRYTLALEAFRQYSAGTDFTDNLASVLGQLAGPNGVKEVVRQRENKLESAFSFMVRIRRYEEAKSYLDKLIKSAGEDWLLRENRPWESFEDWGEMCEGLGDLKKALIYYDLGMEEFERRRVHMSRDELKTAIAGSKGVQFLYFNAARTAVKLAQKSEKERDFESVKLNLNRAFDYGERGRARALLDLIAGGSSMGRMPFEESQNLLAWRQLSAQVATWRSLLAREKSRSDLSLEGVGELTKKIDELEAELRSVELRLADSDPNFYATINPQTQIVRLEEVASLLPEGTALVQYYFLRDDFLGWAITRSGIVEFCHFPIDEFVLNRLVQEYYRNCEAQGDLALSGEELAKVFLEPFAKTLEENSTLIFTPYGFSHVLPFHTLPWSGQPLGTNHTVSYSPNASTIKHFGKFGSRRLPVKILTVGDPANMSYQTPLTDERTQYPPLPASRVEAVIVASLFPEGRALVGVEATEETLRQLCPDFELLHFASHGCFSETVPLLSSILLADGEALTVYEMIGLNLKAHLVVLSACQTALGQRTGGEEVLGLARGVLASGVPEAVVSLWSVNDLSTSLFMEKFYMSLGGDGKTSVSAALAITDAQNYLRTLSNQSAATKVQMILENLERQRLRNPFGSAALSIKLQIDRVKAYLERLKENENNDPDGRPFKHPYFWAPFFLFGGDTRVD
jgi:CHAT domain-containing protein/tetratricopeptide (TPR) repeat protein